MADGYYHTTFSGADEDPLAEGGAWAATGGATGLDWTDPRTDGDIPLCFGSQSGGSISTDDSLAVLAGTWTPDQIVTVKVRNPAPDPDSFKEIQILLRARITAHQVRGYGITYSCRPSGTYVQLYNLKGAIDDIEFPAFVPDVPVLGDGDQVRASIFSDPPFIIVERQAVGSGTWDFILFYDGSADLTVWSDGNPGLGLASYGTPASRSTGIYEFTAINGADTPPSGAENSWTLQAGHLPAGRRRHQLGFLGGAYFVVGGLGPGGTGGRKVFASYNDLVSWQEVNVDTLPEARYDHLLLQFTVAGFDSMLILGGTVGGVPVATARFSIDGGVWTPTQALPIPLTQAAGCVLNGKAFIMGGQTTLLNESRKVFRWTGSGAWVERGNNALPVPLYGAAAFGFDGALWLVGGQKDLDPAVESQKVYRSTDEGATWAEVGTDALGFFWGSGGYTVFEGAMWLAGGKVGGPASQKAFRSTDGLTWPEVGVNGVPVAIFNADLIGQGSRLVLAGGNNFGTEQDTIYTLDPGRFHSVAPAARCIHAGTVERQQLVPVKVRQARVPVKSRRFP